MMMTGRGGDFLPTWFLHYFITLIPLISTKSITPQRISWQNNSLTTVVEAVSSDVLGLIVPPKGISQQMPPFGQLQPCVNFPYDNSCPVILQQGANLIF